MRIFDHYRDRRIDDPASHPFYRSLGREDLIFHGGTRRFCTPEVSACLSIRTVQRGSVTYRLGRTPLRLVPGQFLVLNDGQPYAVEIDSAEPVESMAVYFSPRTVAGVLLALKGAGLDPDLEDGGPAFQLVDRIYADAPLQAELGRVSRLVGPSVRPEALDVQTAVNDLLAGLLGQQAGVVKEFAALSAVRAATRREHYRRLHRARDYLLSGPGPPPTLQALAEVAGMSPFHFQRVFRELFGTSVQRYVTAVRLERAKHQLRTTRHSIHWIAQELGYEEQSSLTRVFVRHLGLTPSAYRRRAGP